MPGEPTASGGSSTVGMRSPKPPGEGDVTISITDAERDRTPVPRWIQVAVAAVLVAAVVLRFLTRSPLWLDEAQTVNIAQRSLPHLFSALREDGAPPLYYVLLHWWMAAFGTSSFAIRALSGVFSVAALPVMAVAARRLCGSERAAWPAVLLLATCPFVVRYATEARMYSLLLLLVLLALIAYERVWSTGGWWPTIGAAVVTGALLLTQYWSLFLLATAGAATIVAIWRGVRPARRLLLPMALGCLAFVPWLPAFAYQTTHTGAPWGPPPGFGVPLVALGNWVGGGFTAPLLRGCYYVLAAIALAGYRASGGGLTFRRPLRRQQLGLLGLGLGTLLLGTVASEISSSAYSPRYTTIAIAPLLLVVAAGFSVVPARIRTAAVGVVCALGLAGAALIPAQLRTQAGQVATVLAAASPHDLVVFCPDQLGPDVHRMAPNAGTQVVYPTFGSSAMVDWVNYAKRNANANPLAFARIALQRARGHRIWLVYDVGYPTLAGACSTLLTSFTVARGAPNVLLKAHGAFEKDNVAEFPAR